MELGTVCWTRNFFLKGPADFYALRVRDRLDRMSGESIRLSNSYMSPAVLSLSMHV